MVINASNYSEKNKGTQLKKIYGHGVQDPRKTSQGHAKCHRLAVTGASTKFRMYLLAGPLRIPILQPSFLTKTFGGVYINEVVKNEKNAHDNHAKSPVNMQTDRMFRGPQRSPGNEVSKEFAPACGPSSPRKKRLSEKWREAWCEVFSS